MILTISIVASMLLLLSFLGCVLCRHIKERRNKIVIINDNKDQKNSSKSHKRREREREMQPSSRPFVLEDIKEEPAVRPTTNEDFPTNKPMTARMMSTMNALSPSEIKSSHREQDPMNFGLTQIKELHDSVRKEQESPSQYARISDI